VNVRVRVNGVWRAAEAPPMKRLLDFLREDLGLTGTKEGCGEGECGACTVLLNGEAVNACLVPVCQADGARVATVEGLGRGRRLSRLQQEFLKGGAQCGICTPGMLMSAAALLARPGVPREAEVREALAGNLCRCTGYVKIVEAVRDAARPGRPAKRGAAKARAARPARRAKPAGAAKKAARAATPARRPARPAKARAARKARSKPARRGGRRA